MEDGWRRSCCTTTPQRKCLGAVCQSHSSSTHREKDAKHGLKGAEEKWPLHGWHYPSSSLLRPRRERKLTWNETSVWTESSGGDGKVDSCKRSFSSSSFQHLYARLKFTTHMWQWAITQEMKSVGFMDIVGDARRPQKLLQASGTSATHTVTTSCIYILWGFNFDLMVEK